MPKSNMLDEYFKVRHLTEFEAYIEHSKAQLLTQLNHGYFEKGDRKSTEASFLDYLKENYAHVNVTTEIIGETIEGEYMVIEDTKQLEGHKLD